MDLKGLTVGDLYLAAIKAEKESERLYARLAMAAQNGYLYWKFRFLASEERRHRRDLSKLYRRETGKRYIWLPSKTPVPALRMEEPAPGTPVSEVLGIAMAAERAAERFYRAFSRRYPVGSSEAFLLVYFSNMERGHYQLMQNERDQLERAKTLKLVCVEDAG
jgi:rubrerythrin